MTLREAACPQTPFPASTPLTRRTTWSSRVGSWLARPASQRLRELIAATGGVARHVILMDASGRIAAVPLPAFNFWQFPKPKFQKTYPLGPGVRHVNVLEWGHDRSFAACWLSETLVDPETGAAIGAFGVELDYAYVGNALCRPTP